MMKRRRGCSQALLHPTSNVCLLLLLATWWNCVDGFMGPLTRYKTSRPIVFCSRSSKIAADPSRNGHDGLTKGETWSKSAVKGRSGTSRSQRDGSRLQVRKRIRAVLEKARTRTGVGNGSVTAQVSPRSPPTVVAEAAAIGGLGDGEADIIFADIDANGISRNGVKNGSKTSTVSTSEPKNGYTQPNNCSTVLLFTDEELVLKMKNGTTKNIPRNGRISNESPLKKSSSSTASTTFTGNKTKTTATNIRPRKPKDFDVIRGDMPSATALCEPLPFKLPNLSVEQKRKLLNGERIQEQSRMGREGSGYVVLDIEAPSYMIWECLLDFESYPELIPTVKSMQLYTSTKLNTGFVNEKPVMPGTGRETRHYGTPSITRASFILSKFRLNIAAIHQYTPHSQGDYMEFTLDPSCTNIVLKGAKGTWYTEENPDGRVGFTRVYLLAGLQISRALPKFIVDYAAERAMPRATTWLRPEVEALKEFLLREDAR